jgi:alpha-ketoglutarate-dependent taurine dioxygenase
LLKGSLLCHEYVRADGGANNEIDDCERPRSATGRQPGIFAPAGLRSARKNPERSVGGVPTRAASNDRGRVHNANHKPDKDAAAARGLLPSVDVASMSARTAVVPPPPPHLPGYSICVGPFTHLADERDRLASLRWRSFEAHRLGSTIGAEISGIDLTSELADAAVAELRKALNDYKVIFFRDQPMSARQHVEFARRFGALELHPFLPSNTGEPELVRFEKSAEVSGYENSWHHDVTWRECPSMGAVLHALDVPEHGGDTLFSDMHAAYDGLDEDTKDAIDDLWAVHDFTQTFGFSMSAAERRRAQEQYPPVRHPVVCTHPETNKQHLYVNRPFVSHIEGMDAEASIAMLDRLCRQADAPEHQCRFSWTKNAVAFWDNRAAQHYASSDYWPFTRTMERASIVGTRPTRR